MRRRGDDVESPLYIGPDVERRGNQRREPRFAADAVAAATRSRPQSVRLGSSTDTWQIWAAGAFAQTFRRRLSATPICASLPRTSDFSPLRP
jgi:hypothetical protein